MDTRAHGHTGTRADFFFGMHQLELASLEKYLISRAGAYAVRWLHHRRKHGFHQRFAVLQADIYILIHFGGVSEKPAGEKNYVPMGGSELLGPKTGKKRRNKKV